LVLPVPTYSHVPSDVSLVTLTVSLPCSSTVPGLLSVPPTVQLLPARSNIPVDEFVKLWVASKALLASSKVPLLV